MQNACASPPEKRKDGRVMCAAPIGNQYAVGHGRPRDLSRELARAEETARHVARLVDRPGSLTRSAARLAEQYRAGAQDLPFVDAADLANVADERLEAELHRKLAAKSRALLLLLAPGAETLIRDLEEAAALAAIRAVPEPNAPKIHADAWSQWVATAAVALDRICPETEEAN
jgi:hypothetical protein